MNKIIGAVIATAFVLFASAAWAQTGAPRTSSATSPVNTLKIGPPKGQGYTCFNDAEDSKYCKCTGTEDCMLLRDSGKCSGEIYENDGGKTGECDSSGADKPTTGVLKLKAASNQTQRGTSSAMTVILSAGANGDTGYNCDYGKSSIPLACNCDGINDCFKLKDSGKCLGAKIKDNPNGVGGSCKP
ncbi:MAG: hypothetical protein L3J04_05650 [Robiginitomaculum sp.]|nr:hypothetical protein [Robiginitomaculum sp.]